MLGDISKISLEAKRHLALDPEVIDSTSGIYQDEKGQIGYSRVFDSLAKELTPWEKYTYSGVTGGTIFQNNVRNWVFGKELPNICCGVSATLGATGAISNALDLYSKGNTTILLPDLAWHNYYLMAGVHNLKVETYPMIENGRYNLKGLKVKADEIIKSQDYFITIINQPSHNPSGYTFCKEEMQKLISIINEIGEKRPVILIYDIAYLDLAKENSYFELFSKLSSSVKVILTYSFSKSLGLYGLRLGAIILLTKSEQDVEDFYERNYLISRTKWSSPNQETISTFNKIMADVKKMEEVKAEIEAMKETLKSRKAYLLKALDDLNIPYYPHHNGFFVTLISNDNETLYKRFLNEKVYAIPVANGIRLAIASLNLHNLERLVNRIKKVYQE